MNRDEADRYAVLNTHPYGDSRLAGNLTAARREVGTVPASHLEALQHDAFLTPIVFRWPMRKSTTDTTSPMNG